MHFLSNTKSSIFLSFCHLNGAEVFSVFPRARMNSFKRHSALCCSVLENRQLVTRSSEKHLQRRSHLRAYLVVLRVKCAD